MTPYIDSHIHLQLMPNLLEELTVAKELGIKSMVCNATGPDDWGRVLDIVASNPNVYGCLGVHPAKIDSLKDDWQSKLKKLLLENPEMMIGECGLDKNCRDMEIQKTILKQHLRLGSGLKRSVHIHCYGAWDDFINVLKDEQANLPPKILLHSHHGDKNLIPFFVNHNAYFSYSSILLPESRTKVRECVEATPVERILVESDAPDLSSSVKIIPTLVKEISKIKGIDETTLIKNIFINNQKFLSR